MTRSWQEMGSCIESDKRRWQELGSCVERQEIVSRVMRSWQEIRSCVERYGRLCREKYLCRERWKITLTDKREREKKNKHLDGFIERENNDKGEESGGRKCRE